MNRNGFRSLLVLLVALGFAKLLCIIAICMVLYFRAQWMTQTDACMREIAESCKLTMEIAIQNRETLSDMKRREVERKKP